MPAILEWSCQITGDGFFRTSLDDDEVPLLSCHSYTRGESEVLLSPAQVSSFHTPHRLAVSEDLCES